MSLELSIESEDQELRDVQSRTFHRLMGYMLRHRVVVVFGGAMIVLGTAATLCEPRLFGYAIDEAIVPKNWDLLRLLSLGYLGLVILRVSMAIGQAYLFELLGQRVTQDLRVELFSHLQRLPVAIYDKNPAGRLLTRVTNDVGSLNEMFSAGFVSIFSNGLLVLGILVWLMVLDLRLGLIAASGFPVLVAAAVYFSGKLKVAYRDARSKLSALNAFLAENIMGMKVVNLFNRQKLHVARFDRVNGWYADAQMGSTRVFALFQPAITVCAGAAISLVIWYGGKATIGGTLKLGVLVAYFAYVLALFQPVREIADKWNIFLSGMASAERIFSILAWPTELSASETAGPAPRLSKAGTEGNLRGHLVFENVWFAYEGERWVIRDLCLDIQPGMSLGVVGHTGAGKTSLINLMMRFYDPQKGRILLDGKDLRDYDRRALRAAIGLVQQDVFLFSGAFKDKLAFDRPESPELVMNTELYERGVNLSVGERQVLAFSRVLARDPQLWILDEATANMDSSTEASLQQALAKEARGKTQILIAHRLATVRNVDRIIVLNRGSLMEQGTHGELLGMDGLYSKLYRYQQSQELNSGASP